MQKTWLSVLGLFEASAVIHFRSEIYYIYTLVARWKILQELYTLQTGRILNLGISYYLWDWY